MVAGVARDAASGTVVALLAFAYSLSFALLLFSGPLIASAPRGVALLLLSAGLASLVVAATGSFRFAVAGPDSAVIAVLAAMVAGLTAAASPRASPAQLELLVILALSGTTLFIGAMLFLFGVLRLGIWIRYVPYPVIGGFLAASGVLLILGALRLLTGASLSLDALPDPSEPRVFVPVGISLGVTAILWLTQSRRNAPLLLPATLVAAAVLIDGALWGLGISAEDARRLGLLLPPVATSGLSLPWLDATTIAVDWPILLAQASEVAVATGVTTIAILLNATGLEVTEKVQMDLDRELRANGAANLLVGAFGGVASNISLNRSQVCRATGATSRRAGVIAGLLTLAAIVVGAEVVAWVPTPVVAGLLLFLGAQLIWQWLIKAVRRLAAVDVVLVLAIPVLAVERGYLEAAAFGVVAACIIFAVKYSSVRVVKHDLTRREYGSYVERSPEQGRFLKESGDLIHILWIQGYLFFGTANRLFESGRARLERTDERPPRFLILDLSDVSGIDSSSVYSFIKLADRVREHGATMALCGVSDAVDEAFAAARFPDDRRHVIRFPHADHALEWAEERLLAGAGVGVAAEPNFEDWLAKELRADGYAGRVMRYLEAIDLEAGEILFPQGDPADSLYFVQSGRVSVMLSRSRADSIRLRSITGHTVVGEMGLYRDMTRAASVVADERSRVFRLSKAALARMEQDEPELSSAFHALIVRILADRLGFANAEIAALQR